MARNLKLKEAQVSEEQVVLDELYTQVERLKEIKPTYSKLEKEVKALTNDIKKKMLEVGYERYQIDNFRVTLQTKTSKTRDTVGIIEYIKERGYDKEFDLLKIIQVLDEQALEIALYNGYIQMAEIQPFEIATQSYSLITKEE